MLLALRGSSHRCQTLRPGLCVSSCCALGWRVGTCYWQDISQSGLCAQQPHLPHSRCPRSSRSPSRQHHGWCPGPSLLSLLSLPCFNSLSCFLKLHRTLRFHHQKQLTPPHGRRRNPSTLQTRPKTVAHTSPTSEVNNWKEISTVGASPLMVFRLVSWAREEDGDGCGHGSDTTILSHLWFWGHQEGADKRQDQVPP